MIDILSDKKNHKTNEDCRMIKNNIKNKLCIFLILMICGVILVLLFLFTGREKESADNKYFFDKDEMQIKYDGVIYPLSSREIKQDIILDITMIQELEQGTLFKLELEQPPVEDELDEMRMGSRYLGYYYVTEDAIYLRPLGDMEGYTDEKDHRIVEEILENEEKFKQECYIVCSEEETSDKPDENGWYSYVEAVGDRRIFYLYSSRNGGTTEYCKIVWQKGAGMVYYLHGAGSRLMEVELYRKVQN